MGLYSELRGSGAPLLLIHGIISDHTFFDPLSECLQDRYSVIVYDRRGYGTADREVYGDFSVVAQAGDAAEVLKKYTDEPVWIFGNSAGGLIGLELLRRRPEMVRGLVMMEPSLVFDDRSREALEAWNRELNEYKNSGHYKKAFPAFSKMTGEKSTGASSGGSALAGLKRAYKNLSVFLEGELNEVQNYRPSLKELQAIRKPVSIAVTEEGKDLPFGFSSYSAAEIIGWDVLWLPGKHNTAQTHPGEAAGLLDREFRRMGKMESKFTPIL